MLYQFDSVLGEVGIANGGSIAIGGGTVVSVSVAGQSTSEDI